MNCKLSVLLGGIIGLTSLNAFSQTRYVDDVFTAVKVTSNVAYGNNPKTYNAGQADKNLYLDFYEPQGDTSSKRRLIIMAHEGGFLGGSKTDNECVDFATRMAKKGYCVASIDYRIGWGFSPINTQEQSAREILPALWRAMQDGKASVRFFRKPSTYNAVKVDPNRIVVGGFGAGSFIFLQNEYLDLPAEMMLPKVLKKGSNGQPLNPPQNYIDTSAYSTTNTAGNDGFEGKSGNPGFPWRAHAVLNLAGAIGDTLFFVNNNTSTPPPVITVQGDQDDITPIGTDIVRAASIYSILEVSGGYDIARKLYQKGINTILADIPGDILPDPKPVFSDKNDPNGSKQKLRVKIGGTYVYRGENYQPYDASPSATVGATIGAEINSAQVAARYMDTTVYFIATRLQKVLTTTTLVIVPTEPTGIENTLDANKISIFPNPNSGEFKIAIKQGQLLNAQLINLQGQSVMTKTAVNNEILFNESNLTPGMYILKIFAKEGVLAQKLEIK